MSETRFSRGDEVDIARGGLPRTPRFEHERATVYGVDVAIGPGVAQQFTIGDAKPTRTGLLEHVLSGQSRRRGNVVEMLSYTTQENHTKTTYYHVVLDSGAQGIYPEESLVPTPEEALGGE